jgi:hypothetical protein
VKSAIARMVAGAIGEDGKPMERFTLIQWRVRVDGQDMSMFTPAGCDSETALAIAIATFGQGVKELENEGAISVTLTHSQLELV